MRKVSEYINATYYYDSIEERGEHVKQMELDGWTCSGQIKETISFYSDEWYWCGKFTKILV